MFTELLSHWFEILIGGATAFGVAVAGLLWWAYGKNGALRDAKSLYKCPVCGYDRLSEPPADFTICSCCGTEFENDDFDHTHEELRAAWIAEGMPWFSRGTLPPWGWDAQEQLKNAFEVKPR